MTDLKKVYKAPTEDAAQQELDPAEAGNLEKLQKTDLFFQMMIH